MVKNPPAMWETWVQSLGWEDPLEKGKATHSSILAWRIFHGLRSLAGYNLLLFSHSIVSDSLQPQGLQYARLPCPSLSPEACSISCPLSQWCHPTISSSVIPFSSCLQSFPASGPFLMSQLFASGGQSFRVTKSQRQLSDLIHTHTHTHTIPLPNFKLQK